MRSVFLIFDTKYKEKIISILNDFSSESFVHGKGFSC